MSPPSVAPLYWRLPESFQLYFFDFGGLLPDWAALLKWTWSLTPLDSIVFQTESNCKAGLLWGNKHGCQTWRNTDTVSFPQPRALCLHQTSRTKFSMISRHNRESKNGLIWSYFRITRPKNTCSAQNKGCITEKPSPSSIPGAKVCLTGTPCFLQSPVCCVLVSRSRIQLPQSHLHLLPALGDRNQGEELL